MNSKQLFFISLIILSVAMGMNWFKNKPKFVKKPIAKNRQAVNLSDLQIQEEKEKEAAQKAKEENQEENDDSDFIDEGEESENPEADTIAEGKQEQSEQDSTENSEANSEENASDTASLENPLKDDPIMIEYFQITRNPFETSPYAQLVEKLRQEAELAAIPEEHITKKITQLKANFSGIIETNRGLVAIIDANLYKKGDEFGGKKITEIKDDLIIFDTDKETFLLPKTGVNVSINAEEGEYTVTDTYDE